MGADVNALNQQGKTPLHEAVEVNCVEVAKLLLDYGADLNAKTGDEGHNALYYAVMHGHIEMTKFLMDQGADLEATSVGGRNRRSGQVWGNGGGRQQ